MKQKTWLFFCKCTEIRVNYNGVLVQYVNQYKFLGNILMSVRKQIQDVFANNYEYLYDQSLNVIYRFSQKGKINGKLV